HLGQAEDGARWMEKALGGGTEDPRALAELEQAYRQAGLWEDLLYLLHRKADNLTEAAERAAVLTEIGLITRDEIQDPKTALPLFQEAFGNAADRDPVLTQIERTYREMGRIDRFAEWLTARARDLEPAMEGVTFLSRAADLYLEVSDPSRAADLLLEVRKSGAGSADLDDRLKAVLEEAGREDDLASLLEDQARVLADPAERVSFLLQRARLFAGADGREGEAEEAYRSVLEIQPDHFESLSELASLLERREKHEELLDLYAATVEVTKDRSEVASIYVHAGRLLLDVIRDPARASEKFRAALISQADNLGALRGLTEAARASDDRPALLEVLGKRAELEPEVEDRLATRVEQADLLLEEDRGTEAAVLLEEAIALDPSHVPAFEKLDAVYASLEKHGERTSVLERLSAATDDRETAARIQGTLGALYRDTLQEQELAADAFERGLAFSPGSEDFLLALVDLYEVLGRGNDQIRTLESLAHVQDGEKAVASLANAAAIAEGDADLEKALSLLSLAREIDPASKVAHDEAARILRAAERWPALIDVLASAFQKVPGAPQAELAREIGRLKRDALEDPEGAVVWLQEVRLLDPEDGENLATLADLLETVGRASEAVDCLRSHSGLVEEDAQKAQVLTRAARLLERALDRPEDALDLFGQAARLASDTPGALAGMRRCAETLKAWDDLTEALEFSLASGTEAPGDLYEALCRTHETKRLDLDKALETAVRWKEAEPEEPGPLRTLASLYGRLDRHEDRAAALEDLIDKEKDDRVRAETTIELGRLRIVRFSDFDGAEKALTRARDLQPEDPAVWETLERFYAAHGRHEDRLTCLEAISSLEPEGAESPLRHFDIARLYEDHLGNPEKARDHYEKAVERDPSFLPGIRGLQRMAEGAGDSPRLAELVAREADFFGADREEGRKARLRLAALRRDALVDEAGAIEAFLEVTAAAPGDLTALHGLEALYSRAEAWGELAGILGRLADLLAHERDRRNAWYRLGLLRAGPLEVPEQAVEAFERSLELDPNHLPALRKLQDTHGALGHPRERLEALDREIAMDVPAPRRLSLLRDAARGWEALEEMEKAVDRWMKIVETSPADAEVLEALEAALEDLDRPEDLERILGLKWKAAFPLEVRLAAGDRRATLLDERLDRTDEARDLLRAVLEEGRPEQGRLERYRNLCERSGDSRGLAWCLDREIETESDRGRRLHLLLEAGELRRETLGDRSGAIERFEKAWASFPDILSSEGDLVGEKTFNALKALYGESGRVEDLVRLLRRRAAYQEGKARGETYAEAAKLAETVLREDALAARLYHVALEFEPDHREALQGSARLMAARGNYGDVVTFRLREVGLEEAVETRVELLLEVASIQEQNLRDFDQAIRTYSRVLEEMPGHLRAFEGLARLLPRRERYRELADLLARQARVASPPESLNHSAEAGRIHLEKLDDPPAAVPHLKKAFDGDPVGSPAGPVLEEALRRTGDVEELARVKEQRLAALPADDEEGRLALSKEIGNLYARRAGSLKSAVGFFTSALKIDPEDLETVRRLQVLYERQGDLTNLARMLEKELSLLSGAEERRAARRRLGELYMRRLGAYDDAIRVYRDMLGEAPGTPRVIESLKRAYRASGLVEDLVKTYELELAQVEEACRKAEILVTLGRIHKRLGRLSEASANLRLALETVPRNEEAIDVLHQVYGGLEDVEGMAEMLDLKAGITPLPEERILLLLEAGSLWEQADQAENAVEAYRAARVMQPQDRQANEGLARLYESLEQWEDLVEVLRVQADVTRSEEEAVSLYGKLGWVWLSRLNDLTRAEESFLIATEMQAEHLPSLEGLERVARAREDWETAVGYIDRQVTGTGDAQRKAHLNIEAGKILEEVLSQKEEALRRYEEALKGDPGAQEALWGMGSIHFENQDWAGAVKALSKLTRRLKPEEIDPAERALMHYRCGYAMGRLDHPLEDQVHHFEQALEADPDHLPSLRKAEAIYFQAGRWAQARPLVARLLEKHVPALEEEEVHRLKVDLGIVLWKTGAEEEGAEHLENCTDPLEIPRALAALEALYHEAGDDDGAISVLERICGSAEDEDEIARANRKIGRILLERKGEGLKAVHYFEKALEGRPNDGKARRGLASAWEQAGRWEEASETWRALAESAVDDRDRLTAWVKVGKVHLHGLGEVSEARDGFQRALTIDPADEEALEGIETTKKTLKDWPGLIGDFEAALAAKEGAPDLEKAPLHFRLGEALVKDGQPEAAGRALERAVTAHPGLSGAHLLLARVYEKRPETRKKAPDHLRAVLSRAPHRIDALRRLSQVAAKLEQPEAVFPPAAILVAYRTHNPTEYEIYENGKDPGHPY
ncbi:MAG: tetratricopeptide repeat protein, partial [Planctomycetota bacterium]